MADAQRWGNCAGMDHVYRLVDGKFQIDDCRRRTTGGEPLRCHDFAVLKFTRIADRRLSSAFQLLVVRQMMCAHFEASLGARE